MEAVIRVTVIYLLILICLRVMGKREFGSLSPMEFVSLLLIPEIVSQAINNDDPSLMRAVVGLLTLLGLVFINSVITYMSKKAQKAVEGEPTVLVHDGTFIAHNMHTQRVTPDEVFSEMHKSGLDQIEQVRWAILDPDGKIAIVPEDPSDRDMRGQQVQMQQVL